MITKYPVTEEDRRRYVLAKDEDFEILNLCKEVETLTLSSDDRKLVKLIKTQLEGKWRKPLLTKLNQLLDKYKTK